MSARGKRQLRTLATFLLVGVGAGLVYNIAQGQITPIRLALGAIYGLMIAIGIGTFEILASRDAVRLWLRALPFAVTVIVRSLVYAAVIFPIQYFDLGVRLVGLKSVQTPQQLWTATAYSLGVSFLFNFLFEVSYVVGPRRLLRLLAGRYHAPREQERFVLFFDLAGSTAAAERLGNRRSHVLLDRVFRVASGPVLDFGGEIYQYVGDEMVVTWSAKGGVRNGRALRCFVAMRAALARASGSFERDFGLAPQARGSLHFGTVVVGEIGDIKRDIVFHGDVMNTAARLEEASRSVAGGFIVSRSANDRLGPVAGIELASLGSIDLRGRSQPIDVFGLRQVAPIGVASSDRKAK